MFHIHTMVAANEEVSRLKKDKWKAWKWETRSWIVVGGAWNCKTRKCISEEQAQVCKWNEAVLWEKLEKNEVKLKSFKNASELIGQYHEKNKPCANIAIDLDYDALNNKKKEIGDKGKATENENVPAMLKKVVSPMFKACEVNFSEEKLIIKQEIIDEDKEKKNTEPAPSFKTEEKLIDK